MLRPPVRSDDEARRFALSVRSLGLIGDPSAEPALLAALESSYVDVRVRAVAALAGAGTPRCVPALIRALGDPAWEVQSQAAKALGRHLAVEAVEPLRDALRDGSWWVRFNSAAALAEIPGGLEGLIEASMDDDPFARDMARARLGALGLGQRVVEVATQQMVKEPG
jgi:HEAT repeat protein